MLLRENRLISSIAAELDQKSCWEVLTDPLISQKYFSPEERLVFQRHILWTRLSPTGGPCSPTGRWATLLEYVRPHQETWCSSPIAPTAAKGSCWAARCLIHEWDDAIEAALADPERWVVQQLATIPVREFPVLRPDGRLSAEPFYTVMGFAATEHGVSILARASQKQVVNVAQRGGLAAVLVSRKAPVIAAPATALDLHLSRGKL